ncbi:hypothetical protein J4E82_010211 [Alternaria postmessia]|uniref:uncharacterized protein n=1 Tax=Alternaria postmessia TaxID=1187938 RepID=UPI0022256DF0|nr:uncharacterized protein J4E82_010211 [Alternaria postmessia]KAI5368969.1 hypothetical protein J4E82_010211 [Alternaria postmessia]
MSTHFRPRPPTSGPPSPTRPSTARSTIRAISPSPPPNLSDALRLDLASTGTPNFDHQITPESARERPKSDGFNQTYMYGFGEQETEFTNYVATAENGNFGSSPADITANVTTKRGGSVMERQSPVKRTSRLSSPKKRPYSTPTELSLHRLSPSHGHDREQGASPHQKQVQVESDSDANWDCPDTPTPMTNSQKRSAYLPLGNPTPCPNSKRSSKPKSRSNPPILTSTISNPTPKLEFFESFDNQSPYHSRYFDIVHPQTYSREEETLREFYAHAERKKMREAMETRARPMERRPLMSQPGYVSSTNDGAAMQRPEREHGIHPRMHLAPRQHAVDAPLRDNVIGPASNVQRQVSISEDSHLSGGTASSKQSVFSTPGRDEMERKKALVEDDEGPFAKAMSMADLDERRRVVSEQRAGDDRRAAILEAESSQKKRKDRACGLGVGCNVM